MTDPPRHDPLPAGEEGDRQMQMHELRQWARAQPDPDLDPVHLLRVAVPGTPGACLFALGVWSRIARLQADAERSGSADELTDIGRVFSARQLAVILGGDDGGDVLGAGKLLHLGVWQGGRWLAWYRPCPPVRLPRVAWP